MVGCKADLKNMIRVWVEQVSCLCTRSGAGGQHKNAGMVFTQAYLIFGADHSIAVRTSDLCYFHGKGLAFGGVDSSAYRGDDDLLAGGHIRGSAYDGQRFGGADIYFCQPELICIWMRNGFQ